VFAITAFIFGCGQEQPDALAGKVTGDHTTKRATSWRRSASGKSADRCSPARAACRGCALSWSTTKGWVSPLVSSKALCSSQTACVGFGRWSIVLEPSRSADGS
jgi:hypothetical protein